MIGKIYIVSSGYDPELGKHVNDPYLGPSPTLGACRHDLRKQLGVGDHIFVAFGKVQGADQFIMAGFEIAEKIHASEAYERFPHLRLQTLKDGQVTGNIIVDANGRQHKLDDHNKFDERVKNYVVGKNLISLATPCEIAEGRKHTLDILRLFFGNDGRSLIKIMGRCHDLSEKQVLELRERLKMLKQTAHETETTLKTVGA